MKSRPPHDTEQKVQFVHSLYPAFSVIRGCERAFVLCVVLSSVVSMSHTPPTYAQGRERMTSFSTRRRHGNLSERGEGTKFVKVLAFVKVLTRIFPVYQSAFGYPISECARYCQNASL